MFLAQYELEQSWSIITDVYTLQLHHNRTTVRICA
jgi:hypothetical protein